MSTACSGADSAAPPTTTARAAVAPDAAPSPAAAPGRNEDVGAAASDGAPETPAPTTGALSVVVRDRAGQPLPGVPVLVDGHDDVQLTSDGGGTIRAELPPGPYAISVVKGCAGEIEVTDGEVARARLIAGQPLDGSLWAEWRHRFAPDTDDHVTDWSRADGTNESYTLPTWTRDVSYVVTWAVIDRCGGALAPNVSIAAWEPAGSANAVIEDDGGRRSDASGMARLTARCTEGGLVSMWLTNARPGEEKVDLLARSRRGTGRPTCGRS